MKSFHRLLIPLSIVFFFTACKSGGDKTGGTTEKNYDLSSIQKAADAISPEINNIKDVFHILDITEAGYYSVLCNDPHNAPNYLEEGVVSAANLGVYVTDIVYHMYGNAAEDMYLSFSAAQELAKSLGLESEFAATLLTELEGDRISRDSLISVFDGLLAESERYSSEKDLVYVHTAFLTGLYIEKIYISSSLLIQEQTSEEITEKDIKNYKQLLAVFRKQLESLDALVASVDENAKDLKPVINKDIFHKLKAEVLAFEELADKLLESEEIKSSEELTTVYKRISEIRTEIVTSR